MRLEGTTALVLGGAGLVGQAVGRELLDAGAACLLVGGLTRSEAGAAADGLAADAHPGVQIVPVWGNIFLRAELAEADEASLRAAIDQRLADDLEELPTDAWRASQLVQLILGESWMAPGRRPDVVVDAVNTATALAYGGVYERLSRVLTLRSTADAAALATEVDGLLASFVLPRLVRHVQLLSWALLEARTQAYVKVGTTGTGGMGLNIPYTHGEEKPSRVLLTKSAVAGAHSMLLMLMSRTPGAPLVKEIKPAAAITWKRIAFGPIRHRNQDIPLFDCAPAMARPLVMGERFSLAESGTAAGGVLESVYIDTGENGLFSIGEYTAITALGQMEAITPQEVAGLVLRELEGRTTGRDVVAALDGAVAGPSYRAGVLRSHAIAEARRLAADRSAASIAFELLGPPRLSKLLFEAELLRRAFGSFDAVAEASPEDLSRGMWRAVGTEAEVRRAAISVGIPILAPGGDGLLCATRTVRRHRWEADGWLIDGDSVERWAHGEWIDTRPVNGARWRERARQITAQRDRDANDPLRSSDLDRRFATDAFDIGETAAWVFQTEDLGYRVARS